MGNETQMYLVIIDFDLTITSDHMHNRIASAIYYDLVTAEDETGQWEMVKSIKPTGGADMWRNLISQLIQEKHLVAIASFGEYPKHIYRYLKEIIGLPEEILSQVFIESWLPEDSATSNKNIHIENIIRHFDYRGNPENIILVDDAATNIVEAQKKNYRVIKVTSGDPTGKHLRMIEEMIRRK